MTITFQIIKELIERARTNSLTEEDQDLIDLLGEFLGN